MYHRIFIKYVVMEACEMTREGEEKETKEIKRGRGRGRGKERKGGWTDS